VPSRKRRVKARGYQLERVQNGETPSEWKSMSTIGSGVQEIRINEDGDAFRVIMIAKLPEAIYVLHCFQKKSRKTSKSDLAIARKRYRDLMEEIGKWPGRPTQASGTPSRTPRRRPRT
jgi:phage-related protein